MAGLFANPWSMVAGALLVSVPVVIHLINRLRYKRVKWAAMEFLLVAQKRVRRKLVAQQLLLLAMRCLVVLLLGLLVARFFGFSLLQPESRATAHVVLLDDSPSMGDPSQSADGRATTAFADAKTAIVEQIFKNASEATTKQRVEVVRLSDLAHPLVVDRLSAQSASRAAEKMADFAPSTVSVPIAEGLRVAADLLGNQPGDAARVLHVVSDFRARDWAVEAARLQEPGSLLQSQKATLHLIDVAAPYRKVDDRRAPPSHDNLSIVEFSPARAVAARYDPVEFTLRVRNNGAAEVRSVRFAVKVNGDENKGRSIAFDSIPGGQERAVKTELVLDRLGNPEKPFERFSLISATLEQPEPAGLSIDNVRHAVVEVRERLPILVIDGKPNLRESKEGDATYLRPVFTAVLGGYSWNFGTVADLEKQDLSRYALVMLLNVPTVSEATTKKLENYAATGGGVGFFLGPDVRPADYNKLLYRDGAGLFPVPLSPEPSRVIPEDELQLRRFRISQKKLLVRDPALRSHPALAGLYTDERGQPLPDADQLERVFGFISIKRHWPVPKVGRWRDDPKLAELYCLPNEQSMADYELPARQLAEAIPIAGGDSGKYAAVLTSARDNLKRVAASAEPLYRLAGALDDFLADQPEAGDEAGALLREFWADPKHADLKRQAERLRSAVKFGDPLYLAKEFGRGRVTLVTTTAGETWSDWPSERPGSASFAPFIKEMAGYLAGAGARQNRLTGEPLAFSFDPTRVKSSGKRVLLTLSPPGSRELVTVTELGEIGLTATDAGLTLTQTETARPGAYLFEVPELTDDARQYRAAAVNVDAEHEGDLRRASRDDILAALPGAKLHSPLDPDWAKTLRNQTSDLSESWYLVLALALVLLAEQWLATRLSFSGGAA